MKNDEMTWSRFTSQTPAISVTAICTSTSCTQTVTKTTNRLSMHPKFLSSLWDILQISPQTLRNSIAVNLVKPRLRQELQSGRDVQAIRYTSMQSTVPFGSNCVPLATTGRRKLHECLAIVFAVKTP